MADLRLKIPTARSGNARNINININTIAKFTATASSL
jgi:hypothetical protein